MIKSSQLLINDNFKFLEISVNRFILEHLVRLYDRFDGDIVLALVLGSIAHHNISVVAKRSEYAAQEISRALVQEKDALEILPCNAHSIGISTGIPRETVRRKISKLIKSGWVRQNEKSELFLDGRVAQEFEAFSQETVKRFLEEAESIRGRVPGKA